MPPGLEHLRLLRKLKLGDAILTQIPRQKEQALALAKYCRENKIYLCFSEFLFRGGFNLCYAWRERIRRGQFHSKADIDEVIDTAGEYYFGRFCIGEIGAVLYGPTKAYAAEWRGNHWSNLPPLRTMAEARDAYVAYVKQFLDYERRELGKGPLLNVEAGMVFKYHAAAGIDVFCLEVMPGDPHLMHAAVRGAARAFDKPWGVHIAMTCYGGVHLDELWQKRWKTSLYYSYISGAQSIWPESGHLTYNQNNRQKFGFKSREMKRVRRTLREAYQFAHIHTRPPHGPLMRVGVVHGNHDGAPGLWNPVVWGQYKGRKWLEGPAERGWRFVDKFFRREDWPKETVQGEMDFSGNPPYGQYDVVPIEAELQVLRKYACLAFLGWNTMTPQIYNKLKQYVRNGGHLVMYLPHLSTEADRGKAVRLFRNGDFTDLFGVKILGKRTRKLQGINCLADSSLKAYRFPRWRVSTDPRFIGLFTPARLKRTTARVISGYCDHYRTTEEELTRQPILVENSLGRGKAFLVAAYEFPADEGLIHFAADILRVVLQGEQGHIRLLSSDRIRYAVYEGSAPGSRKKYEVVYLLNTDPDCDAPARLWIRGRMSKPITVPANELRVAYLCGDVLLLPEQKMIDLAVWETDAKRESFGFFTAAAQDLEIQNLGDAACHVSVNRVTCTCKPGVPKRLLLRREVDPARKQFFAPDFLDEPRVTWTKGSSAY